MLGDRGSDLCRTSSAAVRPVTAKRSLFWIVAKKAFAVVEVPSYQGETALADSQGIPM
jgi:hypothetical protein